jgi:polysaccharide export outer membrane protein
MSKTGRAKVQCVFVILAMVTPVTATGQQAPASATTGAVQAPSASGNDPRHSAHNPTRRYTVHPSDMLELSFPLTPEFNQNVMVQPDGYITLRDAGDIPAAGRTLPELNEAIKKAYNKILHDPVVSVYPKDFEKPYFVVGGQVSKPGKFDWRGDVTLTEAIAIAGGFTDAAKHSQVLLFRRVSDEWAEAKVINVKEMINARNLGEDPMVQPGDMLYIPKNTISKVKPFIPIPTVGMYASQF